MDKNSPRTGSNFDALSTVAQMNGWDANQWATYIEVSDAAWREQQQARQDALYLASPPLEHAPSTHQARAIDYSGSVAGSCSVASSRGVDRYGDSYGDPVPQYAYLHWD